MNITFLIGNGFDIGLGLQTSYEDFYQRYCVIKETDSECIKAFKAYLAERKDPDIKRIIDWADFEKAFGQYSAALSEDQVDSYIECFENFVVSFNEYIETEEKRVDYSDTVGISNMIKRAIGTYYHLREADKEELERIYQANPSGRRYSFVTFNYTKTIDNIAEFLKRVFNTERSGSVGNIVHIHGFVEDSMIMGVDNPSQIANPAFAANERVIAAIVKPRQNSDNRTNYEKKMLSVIDSSDIICIYGMSLGETDKKWWEYLSLWLSKSGKRVLVILNHVKDYKKRFPHQTRKYTTAVKERFLSYSSLPEEKTKEIASRVYVGLNHDVFEMKLCKKEERAEE